MSIFKRTLNTMAYLAAKKNYKLIVSGDYRTLKHWGNYGWCSQGSYNTWNSLVSVNMVTSKITEWNAL